MKVLSEAESEISSQVSDWLQAKEVEDDRNLARKGRRYSPKAVRCLIEDLRHEKALIDGDKGIGWKVPNQEFFISNAGLFGVINGFISLDEYQNEFNQGELLRDNMPEERDDLWEESELIFNSVEAAAKRVKELKNEYPSAKSVLFHGKWNGIPHPEHIIFMIRALAKIDRKYGVKEMIWMVGCDSNEYISDFAVPFLNTDWRMSLISYLPGMNVVFCPGDFTASQAGDMWSKHYERLQPDFVPVEVGDKWSSKKEDQARRVGAEVVEIREGIYAGDQRMERVSSSGILEGNIELESYRKRAQFLLNGIGLSWQRDWFGKG